MCPVARWVHSRYVHSYEQNSSSVPDLDSEMTSQTAAPSRPKTFEWWMLSMFALGISYSAFVSLLIPPFVSDVGLG